MSDENAVDFKDANEKVIRDMINYLEKRTREEMPNEAVKWIIKILNDSGPMKNFYKYVAGPSNQVVQVDYDFEGKNRNNESWELKLSINADVANQARKQKAHFGGEISLNQKNVMSTHKWLPDGMLTLGRPVNKDARELEKFGTGKDQIDFGGGSYANWISTSSKYP
jgi:hypothetical protein